MRFTCLDACANTADLSERGFEASFDVSDYSAPARRAHGPTTTPDLVAGHAFGLNAADAGGGLYRAVVEVDGADALRMAALDAADNLRDIGPDPSTERVRRRRSRAPCASTTASLDIDTRQSAAG